LGFSTEYMEDDIFYKRFFRTSHCHIDPVKRFLKICRVHAPLGIRAFLTMSLAISLLAASGRFFSASTSRA